MEDLDKLFSKVDLIKKEDDAQSIFGEIANGLFNNYCLKKGEIEFPFSRD
jgi:hypothetical protein